MLSLTHTGHAGHAQLAIREIWRNGGSEEDQENVLGIVNVADLTVYIYNPTQYNLFEDVSSNNYYLENLGMFNYDI